MMNNSVNYRLQNAPAQSLAPRVEPALPNMAPEESFNFVPVPGNGYIQLKKRRNIFVFIIVSNSYSNMTPNLHMCCKTCAIMIILDNISICKYNHKKTKSIFFFMKHFSFFLHIHYHPLAPHITAAAPNIFLYFPMPGASPDQGQHKIDWLKDYQGAKDVNLKLLRINLC